MNRRESIRHLFSAGAGLGLLQAPSSRDAPLTARASRLTRSSDDRVVDLVIGPTSAWLPGPDGAERVAHDVWIRVEGSRIAEVSTTPLRGVDSLALPQALILPGLISGHTHVAGGSSTRGIIESGRSYARPLEIVESELSEEELDALTAYNLAELIRSGCTSQVEMSLSLRQARSYVRTAERFGARGWVGGMIPGIARLFPIWFGTDEELLAAENDTLAEIQANLDFARTLNSSGPGLVLGMMTPHAADTHTPTTLSAIASAARVLGTGIHTHLSQGARETATVLRRHGRTPTQWLDEAGLMDGPFFGAHFTAPDWDLDPPVLRRRGALYATCPSAGGAGGSTQPFPEALAAGIGVCVGIDTHSNDMIENLKLAVILGQARASLLSDAGAARPVNAPTVQDALRGCTSIPAGNLLRPDLGVIEPGSSADLVAVDVAGFLSGSGASPPEPLNNLLYANGRHVSWVMTDGRVQVADGRFVAGDEGDVVAAGGRVARRIWSILDAEGWFDA